MFFLPCSEIVHKPLDHFVFVSLGVSMWKLPRPSCFGQWVVNQQCWVVSQVLRYCNEPYCITAAMPIVAFVLWTGVLKMHNLLCAADGKTSLQESVCLRGCIFYQLPIRVKSEDVKSLESRFISGAQSPLHQYARQEQFILWQSSLSRFPARYLPPESSSNLNWKTSNQIEHSILTWFAFDLLSHLSEDRQLGLGFK